jgi:nucleoside-diphosphate-sugar epimerase
MRYAVTGGAGFIGSHLTKQLLKNDHKVIVIDNLHSGKKENIKNLKNVEFHNIDIRNYYDMEKNLKNVDGVFHQAALTDVQESFEKPEEYYDVNVKGLENVFKIAKSNEIKVVFASSASVYGNVNKMPISEEILKNPINPYGKTKLEGEKIAKEYNKNNLSAIGLRYFNVFGIGQNSTYAGVITKFLNRLKNKMPPIIFGNGTQTRDFIYIDDIVDANIQSMNSKINSGFFNIGTGKSTSMLELSNLMIKLSTNNFKPMFKEALRGDIKKSVANTTNTNKFLEWKAKTKLEDGLSTILSTKSFL